MKKTIYALVLGATMTSCATTYDMNYGNINQTEIVLTNANFNNLGNFHGSVTEMRSKASIKNMEGLISRAKADLLLQAKNAGVEVKGSRMLVNFSVDVMKNFRRITVTVNADIIEFTK
jgi:hypothetical protein